MRNSASVSGLALAGFLLMASSTVIAQEAAAGGEAAAPADEGAGGGTAEGDAAEGGGEAAPAGDSGGASSGGGASASSYDHTGFWLAGGFNGHAGTAGASYFRGEVGIPFIEPGSFGFALQLPLFAGYGFSGLLAPGTVAGFRLAAVPGALFEFTVFDKWGRLAVAVEAGAGLAFYGGEFGFNSGLAFVARSGAGPRFVFPFGLLIDLRILGFVLEFGQFGVAYAYEAGLNVGYRF